MSPGHQHGGQFLGCPSALQRVLPDAETRTKVTGPTDKRKGIVPITNDNTPVCVTAPAASRMVNEVILQESTRSHEEKCSQGQSA